MRYLYFLIALLFVSQIAFNQEDYYDPEVSNTLDLTLDENPAIKKNKVNYSVSTGAFVNSGSMFGSNYGTYIMPDIGYQVSERLNIRGGLLLMNTSSFNLSDAEHYSDLKYNNTFMFLRGDYQLTEDILIHGSVYKDLNSMNQLNTEGYSFGLDYKITDKSSIGIEIHYHKGQNPFYYRNPFNPYNSYSNNMFNY
jgi:hypothetical protein